jgi:hypothetical protein
MGIVKMIDNFLTYQGPGSDHAGTYRHELKYVINCAEREDIKLRLNIALKKDPHAGKNGYMIRSLYFDDYWMSAYQEKSMGVLDRKKYRIRIYNYSDATIKLERKKKVDMYIYKEDAKLSRQEFDMILAGQYDFLLERPENLCKEFYYECQSRVLRPVTIVDYEREPYILDEGTVRVTFDNDVRTALGGYDIFDENLPCVNVLEAGTCVMEVKYTGFLPQIVRSVIPPKAAELKAVSKYVLCLEKTRSAL